MKKPIPKFIRFVITNESSMRGSRSDPLRPAHRKLKVRSKLLDMADTRIFNFPAGDLLDRAFGDSATSGNFAPTSLGRLEPGQNELVHGSHATNSNPVFGFTQPSNGRGLSIRSSGMGRPRTPVAQTSPIVSTFIENVDALLPVTFPAVETETDRISALAKRAGVGKETIRRAMRGGANCRLDIVAKIAAALGVTTPQLLTQGFGTMRAAEQRASARQEPIPVSRRAGFSS